MDDTTARVQFSSLGKWTGGNRPGAVPDVTFLYLLRLYPVFDTLVSFLPIGDIISLSRTCKELSNIYQSILPMQWNIGRTLKRFVNDPCEFRSQMGQNNALVSGSVALQFFERVVWKDTEMDVFILKGEGAENFCRYIQEREGYFLAEGGKEKVDEYCVNDVSEVIALCRMYILQKPTCFLTAVGFQVRTYIKNAQDKASRTEIHVVLTHYIPVQKILQHFYATIVVNFFTWNKAYAIFAQPTFIQHKGFMLKSLDEYFERSLAKHALRGWRTQDVMLIEKYPETHPIHEVRRVGDRYTWIIPFDTKNVRQPKTPDMVIEYAQFTIQPNPSYPPKASIPDHYSIKANEFVACTLKYDYTYGSIGWAGFLGSKVNKLSYMELLAMPAPSVPPRLRAYPRVAQAPTPLPVEGSERDEEYKWTYWDEYIPEWYEAWRTLEDGKVS